MLTLSPANIGHQDVAALFVSQPAVAARWHRHIVNSPFGTIHAANFNFVRPLGTTMPPPLGYDLVSLTTRNPLGDYKPLDYPTVDRSNKGDALVARPRPDYETMALPKMDEGVADSVAPAAGTTENAEEVTPDTVELPYTDLPPADLVGAAKAGSAQSPANIYFGVDPMSTVQSLIPWAPGEEPVVMTPRADTDIKLAALTPAVPEALPEKSGEMIAPKGEVTSEGKRPMSPAERLKLEPNSKARAKAEKCLANAVYFEARGEVVRGQMAVAQVVMNRVFSGYYPNDVCGVVYQNAHRHLSCQFTFACDGIPDVVTEPEAWEIAKRIAKDTLDGKLWMPEVAKSTHYHASWVRPSWVNEMKRLLRLGVHSFYRPRLWGDGADTPTWGDPAATRVQADEMQKGRSG